MRWSLTRTWCNGSASTQMQGYAPSKQVLPASPPVITAAVKYICGTRRIFVAVILIFLLAAIYWVSLPQQGNPGVQSLRIQASRNTAPGQTAETTER